MCVLRLAIADQSVTETLRRTLENHSNSLISDVTKAFQLVIHKKFNRSNRVQRVQRSLVAILNSDESISTISKVRKLGKVNKDFKTAEKKFN